MQKVNISRKIEERGQDLKLHQINDEFPIFLMPVSSVKDTRKALNKKYAWARTKIVLKKPSLYATEIVGKRNLMDQREWSKFLLLKLFKLLLFPSLLP